jgi:hypothetical protein
MTRSMGALLPITTLCHLTHLAPALNTNHSSYWPSGSHSAAALTACASQSTKRWPSTSVAARTVLAHTFHSLALPTVANGTEFTVFSATLLIRCQVLRWGRLTWHENSCRRASLAAQLMLTIFCHFLERRGPALNTSTQTIGHLDHTAQQHSPRVPLRAQE